MVACFPAESSVSLSLVWLTLRLFEDELLKPKDDDTALTKDIKHRIVSYLFTKYNGDERCKQLMQMATFLDPRFKTKYFDNRNDILAEMESVQLRAPLNAESSTETDSQTAADTNVGASKKRKLADYFTANESGGDQESRQSSADREIDLYVRSPTVDNKEINVLKWWQDNHTVYPIMSRLAQKFLCVPATVASERAFSCAGLIVSDRRTCLKPEKVNQLIFLKHNL